MPISSIELFFQPTTTVFPKLDWTQRSVVWLDYDDPLTSNVLNDAGYVAGQLKSGSVLAVSCNTERTRSVRDRASLIERLKNDIGPDSIPDEASEQDQVDQGHFNRVIRAAITARVQRAAADRNAGKEFAEKVAIEQIFYYTYEDDAPMLTLGWLIRDAEDHSRLELARLGSIYHARSGVRPFHIKIPKLTPAEMRAINRLDSKEWYEKEKSIPLLKEEIDLFRQVKRYWPMARFMELV